MKQKNRRETEDTTMQVDDADEQVAMEKEIQDTTLEEDNVGESLDSVEPVEESTGESDEPMSEFESEQSAEPPKKSVEEPVEHGLEELAKPETETEQEAETSEEPFKEPVEDSSEDLVEELSEEPVEIISDQLPVEEPAEETSEKSELEQELESQSDVQPVVEQETVSTPVKESGEKKISNLVPDIKVRKMGYAGEEQERKLFVGSLNKDLTTENDLKDFFECYGKIIHISILRDQGTKSSRGFGFILFEETAAIDKIILDKKGGKEFIVKGSNLQIKRALPRVPGGKAVVSQDHFRKVFVGGLSSNITQTDLQSYFKQFGKVDKVELLRDNMHRSRGFAFVTFDNEDSAEKCIQRRTHEISRKLCEVKRAEARGKDKTENGNSVRYSNHNSRQSRQHNLNNEGAVSGGRSMKDINQLIQQALRGVRSVQTRGRLAPAVASSGISAGLSMAPPNNVLFQKLLNNRQAPSAQIPISPASIATPSSGPSVDFLRISQALQGLQGGGADLNLSALLKGKTPPHGRHINNELKHRYNPY